VVVLLGSILLGWPNAASRATTLLEFQLLFGAAIGTAVGSFYAPMMAAATHGSSIGEPCGRTVSAGQPTGAPPC
jgi:hypothetical protein